MTSDIKPTNDQLLALARIHQRSRTAADVAAERYHDHGTTFPNGAKGLPALIAWTIESCRLSKANNDAKNAREDAYSNFYRACYLSANGVYPA